MAKFVGAIIGAIMITVALTVPGAQGFLAPGIGLVASNALTLLLTPSMPKPDAAQTQKKEPRPGRSKGIGTRRVYGKCMFWDTNANGETVDVLAFLSGRSHAVRQPYLNDDKVTITAGVVQELDDGAYDTGKVLAGFRLGLPTETAFPAVISALPGVWTVDHRGDGITSGYLIKKPVKSKNYLKVYPQADNTVLSAVFDMAYLFDPRDPTMDAYDQNTWVKANPLLDNPALGLLWYLLTDRNVDYNTQILPVIDYWIAAANHCDELVPLKGVQTAITTDVNDGATSVTVSSVTGLATGMSIAIGAIDNISHTETRTVTGIAGLVISFSGGLSYDHAAGSSVSWSSDPASPATERRYRCCILYDMTAEPAQVIGEIIKTFDGWYSQDELGRYIVYSGRFYTPTVTIGPAQIVNARHQGFVEDEDFVNEITVTYVSADHDYNEPDATPWRDEDDISERGKTNSTSFGPQSPSFSQNRRLAKRVMARQNAADRGTITTNYDGMSVIGERFIMLNHVEVGTTFYSGPAEITTSPEKDMESLGVTFDWVRVDPNIDAWNPATEEGEPAPLEDRIAPAPLETPTITTATAELNSTGTGARVRIVVEGYDRDDITWYARWRSTTDASWNEQEYSDIDPGPAALLVTSVVPAEIAVDVAVAYSTGDGRVSAWSASSTVSTSTANLAPEPNTAFTVAGDVGKATGSWSNSTSANFGHSELWAGATSSFGSAAQVGSDFTGPGSTTETFDQPLAAGTWFVWTLAFNASDTAFARTGPIQVTVT